MKPILFKFPTTGTVTQSQGTPIPRRSFQTDTGSPITDKNYWKDRYVLCELTLCRQDGQRLVFNDAVCTVSRSKNIVTTNVVGMDGTVKEYISEGDYQVDIIIGVAAMQDGVLVDEYPEKGLTDLRDFLTEKSAITVHSNFLELFEITQIVIKSFSVAQDTASNYQSVTISALSDSAYNVYCTEY